MDYQTIEGRQFYPPMVDNTGRIALMQYVNNELSYGVTAEGKFALCDSPILSAVVLRILSEHDTFSDAQDAFFEEIDYRRAGNGHLTAYIQHTYHTRHKSKRLKIMYIVKICGKYSDAAPFEDEEAAKRWAAEVFGHVELMDQTDYWLWRTAKDYEFHSCKKPVTRRKS